MKKSLFSKVDCIRIPVTNLEDGLDFYSKKLGHKLLWKTDNSAGLILSEDKSEIVLYTEQLGLEIDFKVDNVKQAIESFLAAGGEVVTGPFEIQIGMCAVVKDPWDNQYIILDSSKGILETNENKQVIGLQ